MNDLTRTHLRLIGEIKTTLDGVDWWLFGGWGLDARVGRVTRDHHDVEIWIRREDADRTRDALVAAGFEVLEVTHPDEAQEFIKDGVDASSAFLHGQEEDGWWRVGGRWSDWRFPPDSFATPPGRIGDLEVPAMSVRGMLAMKEQYPALRNGKPLRPHDIRDIEILTSLL